MSARQSLFPWVCIVKACSHSSPSLLSCLFPLLLRAGLKSYKRSTVSVSQCLPSLQHGDDHVPQPAGEQGCLLRMEVPALQLLPGLSQ